jgi:hypothetical protein
MVFVTVGHALGADVGLCCVIVSVGRVLCVRRVVGCFLWPSSSRFPQLMYAEEGATGGRPKEKLGKPRPYVGSCASASRLPHEMDAVGGTKLIWSLGVGAGRETSVGPSSCLLPHEMDAAGGTKLIWSLGVGAGGKTSVGPSSSCRLPQLMEA